MFSIILFAIVNMAMCQSMHYGDDAETDEKGLYNFGLGKRAYSYVSEFKRLPVYDFGLGKRAAPNMYSFGLGKRDYEEDPTEPTEEDTAEVLDKRSKQYDFGLGKRVPSQQYNFGLGKKELHQYGFGLGKRLAHYNFGLGKRHSKMYGFGLGKKDKMYSFGLGKRSYPYTDYDDTADYEDVLDEAKRQKLAQKFDFGLGKRELFDELEADITEKRNPKQLRYSIGLGKRNADELSDEKELKESGSK